MIASAITQIQLSEGTSDLSSFEWPADVDLGFSDFSVQASPTKTQVW